MAYNDGKPFGVDISAYQGQVDFGVLAPQVKFIAIRSGISWAYSDKWFSRNWIEAKRVGIPRATYHVIYPDQPILQQIEHWLRLVGDDLGEFPFVVDFELVHDCSKNQMRDALLMSVGYVESMTGKRPIIYSRANIIDDFCTFDASYNTYDWWLAGYLSSGAEAPGPVDLPNGIDRERCIIHQTGDHTTGVGFGVESKMLDYNRWQGDEQSLHDYLLNYGFDNGNYQNHDDESNDDSVQPEPSEDNGQSSEDSGQLTDEQSGDSGQFPKTFVTTTNLNFRTEPDDNKTESTRIGTVAGGKEVSVAGEEIETDDFTWVPVSMEVYMATKRKSDGNVFLKEK